MQCDSITHTGQIPRPNLPREPDIPRQIWGFWDKDDIPPLVQRCINTWFIVHFNWDIHIVTPENVSTYLKPGVDIPKNLMRDEGPAKQSDMIRFALLYKYGGVYIDATTLMTYPGVAWMRTHYRDWFSFDGEINIIASAPKGRVISILYPAMFQMLSWKRGVERFKMIRKTYNITSPYLYTQHVIQRILKNEKTLFPILGMRKKICPWHTMYSLWTVSSNMIMKRIHRTLKKKDVLHFIFNTKSPVPKPILQNTLHKLQGAWYTATVKSAHKLSWFSQIERRAYKSWRSRLPNIETIHSNYHPPVWEPRPNPSVSITTHKS